MLDAVHVVVAARGGHLEDDRGSDRATHPCRLWRGVVIVKLRDILGRVDRDEPSVEVLLHYAVVHKLNTTSVRSVRC